jgi:5S rRNA maturation endonuclease (ribonuclease M5)
MLASEFANRLNAQKTSSGWQAKCPGHDDKNASLSISEGHDGRVLLKCHAGCDVKDIVSVMGLKMSDLFNDNTKKAPTPSLPPTSKKIVATYPYHNADGQLLYEVIRYMPKDFRQRRPDGKGDWSWNLQGVERVLYRLPEVKGAIQSNQRVFIVEGEKDVEALVRLGLCATCNSGGAGKWQDSFSESLRGAYVVIIPDNDEPGLKHGQAVAEALQGKAKSIRVVELGARLGVNLKVKDAHDWISAGGTRDELEMIVTDTPEWMPSSEAITPEKPVVCLPGGAQTISATSAELGKLMSSTFKFFIWGGALAKLSYSNDKQIQLEMVKPCGLASDFESVAMLVKPDSSPTVCSEQIAKTVSMCESFKSAMPVIKVLTRCPVLVQRSDGTLEQVTGYDRESGIYADGEPVDMMDLGQALPLLNEMLDGFCFATPSDKARALASLITPALVLSGLLPGRAPIDLGEANDSQAGKGYRNKLTAALYAQEVKTITQQKSGVGSMEESFNAALIRGSNFICLDNVRGKIDSPAFESFMTENVYSARVPYRENVEIDPRRVIVMMTSNKAEMTVDLANRCSTIRILKQPAGYEFKPYPEGDLLEHVKANRKRFLGAVFSVVGAWHAAGKPKSNETRHDFRAWVQILDWIVQNLLEAGPIMDGHRATQERMTNPSLGWLREIALEAVKVKKLGVWLQAKDILELIAETDMETALCTGEQHVMGEDVRKTKLQAIGRKMRACFR